MQLHEHLNQSINIRCTDGWIDGWMDIWRDQWMKHWIDRFKHRWCIHAHSTARVCFADFLRSWPPSTDFPAEEDCPEPAWLWQFQYAGQMHALKSLAEFRQKDARIFSQVWESLRCHIFLCYIRYIYIYLACWSFRWGEIWVEVHSKNHPCVAWTSCGPCGSQSKLQDAELRLFEISEVGGSDPLWNYVCLLMVMVLWVFFLMTKWSCKLSSGKNSLQVYRLLWRLSECITQFGKFLGIPNVTLPAPDLKTLAM